MAAQHDAGVALLRDRANQHEQVVLPARVEAERRLVEEHHARVVDQRAGDPEALAHAAAVRPDQRLPAFLEPHLFEQRRRGAAARP